MSYHEYKMGIISKSEWAYENRDESPDDAVPKERCENCRWYRYIDCDDEWVCVCRDSVYCAEPVDDLDYCDEWEKKHEEK